MAKNFMRRWFSEGPDNDPAGISACNTMTTAFLQTDQLLAEIEDGIAAAGDTDSARQAVAQWAPVRERHAVATERYLQLQRLEPDAPYGSASVYQDCTRALQHVSAEMVAFRERFGENLARVRAAREVSAQAAHHAHVAANQAVAALDLPENRPFLHYPSVVAAVGALSEQVRTLDTVSDPAGQREAATAVSEAAAAVHAAVAAAPQRGAEVQNAVRSIQTRISAVATRAEQLAPARSALLREFSAACSIDLVDNDRVAAKAASAAERELEAARSEISAGRPEAALARCARAREHLREADDAVDAVTARLRSLREVRKHPSEMADKVRFRLRDAQLLAVQRNLVNEWGSVLDAQVDRIDRACASLGGVSPDYWTYLTDLEAIDRFIVGVVNRMRGRE